MNQTFVLNGIDGKPKGDQGRPENQEDDRRPEGNPKETKKQGDEPSGPEGKPEGATSSPRWIRTGTAPGGRGTPRCLRGTWEATSTPLEVFGLVVASERGLF